MQVAIKRESGIVRGYREDGMIITATPNRPPSKSAIETRRVYFYPTHISLNPLETLLYYDTVTQTIKQVKGFMSFFYHQLDELMPAEYMHLMTSTTPFFISVIGNTTTFGFYARNMIWYFKNGELISMKPLMSECAYKNFDCAKPMKVKMMEDRYYVYQIGGNAVYKGNSSQFHEQVTLYPEHCEIISILPNHCTTIMRTKRTGQLFRCDGVRNCKISVVSDIYARDGLHVYAVVDDCLVQLDDDIRNCFVLTD